MTQLSPHFTLEEMCVTNSGLPNVPGAIAIENLTTLCTKILEPIRNHFGKPVKINSGFRSPAVNLAAGSKVNSTSQHLFGEAADIEIPGVRNDVIWSYIVDVLKDFDQVIAEKLMINDGTAGWIHVSWREDRLRREALSWDGHNYRVGLHYVA